MKQLNLIAVAALTMFIAMPAMALRPTASPAGSVIDVIANRDDDDHDRSKVAKKQAKRERQRLKELRKAQHEREKEIRKYERERLKDLREAEKERARLAKERWRDRDDD